MEGNQTQETLAGQDELFTPPAPPVQNELATVKGMCLTIPVIGRIATGHRAMVDGRVLPVKDDHFSLTTLCQDVKQRSWQEHPLQKTLMKAGEKLCSIPVRIAYNDVNLNLQNSYSAFDKSSGRVLCTGNGDRARRVTEDGVKEIVCPGPSACEYAAKHHCKNFTRAYFRIEGQSDELGAFVLRTTSYNSLDRLGSRLNQLAGLTGGCIANMPMQLVLRCKTSAMSRGSPVYFSDLENRPGMSLIEAAKEARDYQNAMAQAGLSIERLEDALRAGLAKSAFADELEDADVWLSDNDLVSAVERQSRTGGLKGMDSLAQKLGVMQAAHEEYGASGNVYEGSAESVDVEVPAA